MSAVAGQMRQVLNAEGALVGDTPPHVDDKLLRRMYTVMLQARLFDERALALQRQGRIGFYVPANGQEAAQIGTAATYKSTDWIFPAYREIGVALWRGVPITTLTNQFIGNAKDIIKGRQMPNHYGYKKWGLMSPSSPIATQIPHAVGWAMAAKIKRDPHLAAVYFGDGATSEGDFHVSMNFAGVYKSPVVFNCQNNHYAISLPVEQQTASETIAVKGVAYGIPGVRVDGNDVLAVFSASTEAVARARRGEGPTLIELVTYRMGPHSTSDDPSRYRPDSEVAEWKRRDPLVRFEAYLRSLNLYDGELDSIREQYPLELAAQIKEAESVGPPDYHTLVEDVFEHTPWHLEEAYVEFLEEIKEFGGHAHKGIGG